MPQTPLVLLKKRLLLRFRHDAFETKALVSSSRLLPFFARPRVPRRPERTALARFTHLDERVFEVKASVGIIVWLDAEDPVALSSEAVESFQDFRKAREVKLDEELYLVCRRAATSKIEDEDIRSPFDRADIFVKRKSVHRMLRRSLALLLPLLLLCNDLKMIYLANGDGLPRLK